MEQVVERFLKYVKFDTKSNPKKEVCPSTKGQLTLGAYLVQELKELGLVDANMDSNGYVMATLPANTDQKLPTIGFIAHMDTSPDMSGENVKPQLVENYDGKDIVLNAEKAVILSPKDFPELRDYIGETLITTDGTTLLGADDKAGIAEIITAVDYLIKHPEIKHGSIKVGFTPDEEIGRGADLFNVEAFGADWAYTLDGGPVGELEFENFNAAGAKIMVQGRNVHPGTAKNKMVNAILIAMELQQMLPVNERPEYTQGYEGFFHLNQLEGSVEEARMEYIIRDHNRAKFEEKKQLLIEAVKLLNMKYGAATLTLDLKDQYYNMEEMIRPVMSIIDLAREAMEELNIAPLIKPIRGGTDGARLSYMNLPCPNIFTGGHNFHGKYEYIPVNSMKKAVQVILKLVTVS